MSDTLLVERTGAVAVLTMNRPEKHNALNDELLAALSDALSEIAADDAVRAVVLTGAGDRAFCAGRDMSQGLGGGQPAVQPRGNPMAQLQELTKPTIAAINGYAYGGGALLSFMCDLRLASSNATFRLPGSSYGLAVGGALLAALIGPAQAKYLLYTCETFNAQQALSLRLLNEVTEGDVKQRALALAEQIAQQSAAALAACKRLIDDSLDVRGMAKAENEANAALRRLPEQGQRFQAAAERIVGRPSV